MNAKPYNPCFDRKRIIAKDEGAYVWAGKAWSSNPDDALTYDRSNSRQMVMMLRRKGHSTAFSLLEARLDKVRKAAGIKSDDAGDMERILASPQREEQ